LTESSSMYICAKNIYSCRCPFFFFYFLTLLFKKTESILTFLSSQFLLFILIYFHYNDFLFFPSPYLAFVFNKMAHLKIKKIFVWRKKKRGGNCRRVFLLKYPLSIPHIISIKLVVQVLLLPQDSSTSLFSFLNYLIFIYKINIQKKI